MTFLTDPTPKGVVMIHDEKRQEADFDYSNTPCPNPLQQVSTKNSA
jgi:hypothetical protein